MPTHANTSLEEIGVALNLLWPLHHGRLAVIGVQNLQRIRHQALGGKHKQQLVLFQDIDLCHDTGIKYTFRLGC